MKIHNLYLVDFRNFSKNIFDFNELTVILGNNAAGKTSIIEAINLLASTKSFRANYDKEMIKINTEFARIEANVEIKHEQEKLELYVVSNNKNLNTSKKLAKINGVSKTLNNFAGNLNCVYFTPMDIEIINEGPSARRKYIDSVIIQTHSSYRKALSNLTNIIKNRNKVLEKIREENKGYEELNLWNQFLVTESSTIHDLRIEFFEFIKPYLIEIGHTLNNSDKNLEAIYKPSLVTKERLLEYKEKEIITKTTLIGPQRDDFTMLWNDMDLYTYGSRGYQRTAILALKLCEIEYIKSIKSERPILLLDDVLSELDESHREQIINTSKLQQTIITTTDESTLDKYFPNAKIIKLDR